MGMRFCEHDPEIGKRFRELRMRAGKSQMDMGHALGVTFQQVQKIENGANRISAGRLLQTAIYLGVPVTEFYDGIAVVDVALERPTLSDDALRVAMDIDRLPDEHRNITIDMIRAMLRRVIVREAA